MIAAQRQSRGALWLSAVIVFETSHYFEIGGMNVAAPAARLYFSLEESMNLPFSGGCACGALRYECSAAPLAMLHCHCRDCQRASGTAFSSALAVPVAAVKIHGVVKYHEVVADSGHTARRGFCPECGSPVFAGNTASPQFLAIKPGSLDNPSWFQPMGNIWTASAQPWVGIDPKLPQFPRNPVFGS